MPLEVSICEWEKKPSPYYNASHRKFRKYCREYVEKHLVPKIAKWEKKGDIPKEVCKQLFDAGLYATFYPKNYGGTPFDDLKYMDAFHKLVWKEEFCRLCSGGFWTGVFSHGIAIPPVLFFGSKELKAKVRPVIQAEKFSALAISEPKAGSDVRNLVTTARKEGDNYIVNGEKYWISGGMKADYFVTAVRTGGPGINGISLLLIERGPGVFTSRLPLQGHDSSPTAYVIFRNVKVPCTNIVGKENEGFKPILFNFNQERYNIAIDAVYFSRMLIEESVKYARGRKTFGKRLIEFQVIQQKITNMARKTLACHAWLEELTYRFKTDVLGMVTPSIPIDVSLFKPHATMCFEYCAREASQIFGGRSYVRGGRAGKVERLYRDVRAYAIYGGSEEIMLDLAWRMSNKLDVRNEKKKLKKNAKL